MEKVKKKTTKTICQVHSINGKRDVKLCSAANWWNVLSVQLAPAGSSASVLHVWSLPSQISLALQAVDQATVLPIAGRGRTSVFGSSFSPGGDVLLGLVGGKKKCLPWFLGILNSCACSVCGTTCWQVACALHPGLMLFSGACLMQRWFGLLVASLVNASLLR